MYLDFTEIKQLIKEDLEKEENTDKCQCKECVWKNCVITILSVLTLILLIVVLTHIKIEVSVVP